MKRLSLLGSALALSLTIGTPAALAHVGHGDEFQAEGGVDRVEVNADTDSLMGIQVSPIESAEGDAVLIPVSALVEDNERQLVFVQYENFYEPVPVTTGETQGELIEITEGLSVGEQLVTQGSLSLYAESRKTQNADADEAAPTEVETSEASEPTAETAETTESEVAEAPVDETEESGGAPVGLIAAIGAGIALVVGAIAVLSGGKKEGA